MPIIFEGYNQQSACILEILVCVIFENPYSCTSSFLVKKCAKMLKYGCGETIKTVLLERDRNILATVVLCCDSLVSVDMLTNDLQHQHLSLVPANKNCAVSSRFPELVW